MLAGLLVATAAATVATGWRQAGPDQPAGPVRPPAVSGTGSGMPTAPHPEPPRTWRELLHRLDAARVAVWESGRIGELDAVDLPGSPAARADRAAWRALRSAGLRPVGMRLEIRSVDVAHTSARRAVLRVVDERPAYVLRDDRGRVVRRVAQRARKRWRVVLERPDEQWLVARVRAAPG